MKVLIAEDDILIAEHLNDILEECKLGEIIVGYNYKEIIHLINTEQPDLILLDIHMDEELTGIKIAQEINANYKIPFIYITAQSDKMVMDLAIETKPFGYIIKPFNSKEIYATLQLAKNVLIKKHLFIKDNNGDVKLMLDKLKLVKSDGNYLDIITVERKFVIRSTISSFLKLLPTTDFHQVHRSYIININFIQKTNGDFIYIDEFSVPCSKKKMAEIKSKIA
jgi:two-component system, LytTR family, response regulator LytT